MATNVRVVFDRRKRVQATGKGNVEIIIQLSRLAVKKSSWTQWLPCLCCGFIGVIYKSTAIANFGIEHLTGGLCLVALNQIEYFIRHLIVCTPLNIWQSFIYDNRRYILLLLKYLATIHRKTCACLALGKSSTLLKLRNSKILLCFQQNYGAYKVR